MKRRFALFAAALTMATPCIAADAITVGYVNMQEVLEKSKLGKRAQETLKQKFGPKSQEFAKEEQAIRQQQQTLERDKPLMSKDQIKKKEDELKKKVEEFQKTAGGTQQELAKEQQKLAQAIVGPAQEVVQALSKEKKMSLVFERSQAGLLYVDSALNLTDEVIKRLDERAK
jgi:outer membrane protein